MKVQFCFSLVLILIQFNNCFGKRTMTAMEYSDISDGCCHTYNYLNCFELLKIHRTQEDKINTTAFTTLLNRDCCHYCIEKKKPSLTKHLATFTLYHLPYIIYFVPLIVHEVLPEIFPTLDVADFWRQIFHKIKDFFSNYQN